MNKIVVKTLFSHGFAYKMLVRRQGNNVKPQLTSIIVKKNPYYHDISAINNFQVSCIVHQK